MKRKALVQNNKIADIIIADDDFKPPVGCRLIDAPEAGEANVGDFFENGRFVRPRPKLKREDLLRTARTKRQIASLIGFSFTLESGTTVKVPTDNKTRQDLFEIASLDIACKFVFPDGQFDLTAKDFAGIVREIAERTAANYATLAKVIEAIDNEQIIFEDQVNSPEKLGLNKWPAL